MHALTLARQRIRARLQNPSTPQGVRLAHGLVADGKGWILPALPSALAQEILTRGYDARTLERVYNNRPTGDLGLLGRLVDRKVLNLPHHLALRERLQASVGEMAAAAVLAIRAGETEFRILAARCGMGMELARLAERLRADRPEAFARLRCWGVDLDPDGDVLPEAARRTRAIGLNARFIREDLRRHREVGAVVSREGPFHLVTCLGIATCQPLAATADLVRYYSSVLAPGGTLLIDRWECGETSSLGAGLGIHVECQRPPDFVAMLRSAALSVVREHTTGEGGCVLVVARKTH